MVEVEDGPLDDEDDVEQTALADEVFWERDPFPLATRGMVLKQTLRPFNLKCRILVTILDATFIPLRLGQ